ncbi:TetR/AcrR family transcriptional regulator [Streptomyces sp. ST2-7A]|uniref:TetR/AcrR family transcriptional regulator n=1 Tax=Streptomyces sp. ST2-7A TaxID=2907214 RepID=UPI001F25F06F|nr:helix-turn-helix domain-containing protein [Streptomyces sp. ST2-7A]MCE7080917.1 TetR/AcrR family transcriptional regulator [Streptomyces sp. ST2-7A]
MAVGSALRTDARRNLHHVLSAARDVFGELGYDAPIEEIARRARVGVGTVYRRFPTKGSLIRHIIGEETRRLTERAEHALGEEGDPWAAVEDFVRDAVDSGVSRLLPELPTAGAAGPVDAVARVDDGSEEVPGPGGAQRVPRQRRVPPVELGREPAAGTAEERITHVERTGDGDARLLVATMERLLERARRAGRVRPDVTVADLVLVISTVPPTAADPTVREALSSRLLELLLAGLRPAAGPARDGEGDGVRSGTAR